MAAKRRQAGGAADGRGERSRRTYGDRCGVARALDMVGERWALLVVRELLLGPKRFTDLRTGLPHVSTDILAQRLRELEQSGVVRRAKLPPPAGSRVYELTERGRALEPIVLELGRWGSVAPFPPGEADIGADALAIALKSLFVAEAAAGLSTTIELHLGEDRFSVRVSDGALALARGGAETPDATLESDPATLATVLWHGRDPAAAERAGDLAIEGDRRAAKRFLGLFPLPAER
jgi:DNA-binding HxlR family transcriptional regulator/putative sterol carrier protein